MKPVIAISTQVNAPVDRVFDLFSDLRNAPGRIKAIKKLEVLTDGPIRKGTRFRETRIMFNKEDTVEMEVTEFEPGRSYTIGGNSCGCEFAWTLRFAPSGSATNVEMEMRTRAVSLFAKIMSPLSKLMMGPMMKKCMEQDMADLRAIAESNGVARASST